LVGRQLGDERLARDGAAGLHHTGGHVGVVAEGHTSLLDVGTGDVDLDGVDGRIVEQLGDGAIFLDGGPGYVGDEARLGEIELGKDLLNDIARARILQSDGIEHAVGRFRNAVRRVAEARLQRRSFEAHGARVAIGEAHYAGILLPETYAA